MRLQLALNVDDLETAIDHYTKMFDTEPHKVRDGYANFAIAEPPLKLVLFENPDAVQHLNHIGVEMFGSETIEKTSRRFEKAGILKEVQLDTVCCHARPGQGLDRGRERPQLGMVCHQRRRARGGGRLQGGRMLRRRGGRVLLSGPDGPGARGGGYGGGYG